MQTPPSTEVLGDARWADDARRGLPALGAVRRPEEVVGVRGSPHGLPVDFQHDGGAEPVTAVVDAASAGAHEVVAPESRVGTPAVHLEAAADEGEAVGLRTLVQDRHDHLGGGVGLRDPAVVHDGIHRDADVVDADTDLGDARLVRVTAAVEGRLGVRAVAVLVDPVVQNLVCARVDVRVGVVAVGAAVGLGVVAVVVGVVVGLVGVATGGGVAGVGARIVGTAVVRVGGILIGPAVGLAGLAVVLDAFLAGVVGALDLLGLVGVGGLRLVVTQTAAAGDESERERERADDETVHCCSWCRNARLGG